MKFFVLFALSTFSVAAMADQSNLTNYSSEEKPIMCGLSATERYCFVNATCDGGHQKKIACSTVRVLVAGQYKRDCPSVEDCLAEPDPVDIVDVSERLALSRVVNSGRCTEFASEPSAPPVRSGGGGR